MNGGEKLLAELKNEKLKSAYLVTGLKLSVLNGFAEKILLNIYCKTKSACRTCPSCKKILSNSAADVLTIRPENAAIKVDQIRELKAFLYEKPFEADLKSVIIFEADKMTPAAQNALLKPLEQPPENAIFFLFSQSDYGILPTVISRCENVRLRPPSQTDALSALASRGIPEKRAHLLIRLSGGYIDEAERLNEDQAYFGLRDQTIRTLKKLLDQKTYAITHAADFFEENKDNFGVCLDIMKLYLTDILKAQYQTTDLSINIDDQPQIAAYGEFFTTAVIYNMIEKLLEYEQRLIYNVNFRLTIESMLFDILKEKYR